MRASTRELELLILAAERVIHDAMAIDADPVEIARRYGIERDLILREGNRVA